jgi:hypothetical protein
MPETTEMRKARESRHYVGAVTSTGLLFALGCGGPGSFEGKVAGNELEVEDAIFLAGKDDESGATIASALVMTDLGDLCATLKANREPKNATLVWFILGRIEGTELLVPDKGTYTVVDLEALPPPRFAFGYFSKNDAACRNTLDEERAVAQSGTIEVEKIEFKKDGSMKGEFDARFGSQNDAVKGTFNASFCDAPLSDSFSCQ